MDDQLLLHLYHRLFPPGNGPRAFRCMFSDAMIVLIYFFAVIRDRSGRWACCKNSWPLWMRRLACPSYSQFNRRIKTASVRRMIGELNAEFRGSLEQSDQKFCDGKPLAIGGFSKDPDSAQGYLPGGGWGRGYKVHVIADACGAVDAFAVTALDAGEPTITRQMVADLDLRGILLCGDSNYDSNPLYAAVAARGGRLIAWRKKPGRGLGHQPHHPDRLRAIAELESDRNLLRSYRRRRIRVEQELGHWTNLPFGLSPLPNFVRRHNRVQRWVLAKLTLYHLYLSLRHRRTLAA